MRMSSFLLSLAAAAGFASAAQAEKVISINFCQVSSADMRIASDAVVATPVGTIPGSAWAQSTQNGATSAYTFTGSKEYVITDGSGASQDLASTFSVSEYMVNMGNHGQITTSSGANMSPVLKSWLGFKNPSDLTRKSSRVVVSNIPYATYDAIVIMSGYTSTHYCDGVAASQVQGTDFPAVTVNGTAYTYSNSNGATEAGSGNWGQRGNDSIAVGTNALRINGLSGDLTLDLSAADFGIAGVQIVESTTEHFNIEEYAATHNDGYVRDGVTYNYIFRGTDATYPNNWGTCSNWYTRVAPNASLGIEEEFWSPYASFTSVSSKNAPLVGSYGGNSYAGTGDDRKSESPYDSALVDGALIDNFDPDTPITMSFCEGWAVKMGVYGGAKLEINRIGKLQSNSGTKWFRIGTGSKITVRQMDNGTCNNDVKFYIAEHEGFVWDCSLSSNFANGRYEY